MIPFDHPIVKEPKTIVGGLRRYFVVPRLKLKITSDYLNGNEINNKTNNRDEIRVQ